MSHVSVAHAGRAGRGSAQVTIVHISDTHCRHRELTDGLPPGDVLIHSGDILNRGEKDVAEDFNAWLGELDYAVKVVVIGNHDTAFKGMSRDEIAAFFSNADYYVQNETVVVEPFGFTLWGSPVTNCYPTSMFGVTSASKRNKVWGTCPAGVDVAVTHMPPLAILDLAWHSTSKTTRVRCDVPECGKDSHRACLSHWGDAGLRAHMLHVAQPSLHLFGHVHDEVGSVRHGRTRFVNSAINEAFTVHTVSLAFDPHGQREALDSGATIVGNYEVCPAKDGAVFLVDSSEDDTVLDVDRGVAEPGNQVILWKKLRGARANQTWRLHPNGGIVSSLDDDLMLAHDGSGLVIDSKTNSSFDHVVWRITTPGNIELLLK
ncbi:Ser/Thr protein phosphatase [Thecamonas trahens ATCC 50062]|uniref:Ser/Thr protein phosphatase n=1 Tax=Thecamonas trahens ATCC 50062 TaxID=461836 RepID=A0A0L0D8M2_THETB|nr:Ser/Thr protein phosphatase [Thecamonas trahens ATCC 50062]KNC47638.1 Ser/Thr protein phosphatase [Thecamonas trahens ATCC 50062]|eukprot:XP_013759122.1 Ser/Thr protein phosphatase [Thecamonas trahens ATCC 50062]